jgi:hypothetical protein
LGRTTDVFDNQPLAPPKAVKSTDNATWAQDVGSGWGGNHKRRKQGSSSGEDRWGDDSGRFHLSSMMDSEVEISLGQIRRRKRIQAGLAAKRCAASWEGDDWHDDWRHMLAIGGSFFVNDFNFRDRPRFSILLASLSLKFVRYSS